MSIASKVIIPAILGYPIVTTISHLLPQEISPWGYFLLLPLYLWLGYFIKISHENMYWKLFFIVLVCVPVAVILDVLLDWSIWGIDRNLFPIEIVILWVVGSALLLVGMLVGKVRGPNKALNKALKSGA